MYLAIQTIPIIISILVTLLILLHGDKGGGLSSLLDGGMQSNLSGSTVVEKNLDRVATVTMIIWLLYIVLLLPFSAFGWQASYATRPSVDL